MTDPAPPASPPTADPEIELFCPRCGYSLRGIVSENCPECGLYVDRSAAAVSRIPWEHRRRIGRVRAYWRTLWMPTRAIAGDMVRPVSYRDARRFQLVTVLITSLPLVAMAALPLPPPFYKAMGNSISAWPMVMPPGWAIDVALPLIAGVGLRVLLPIAIVLYFLAMTGVGSYFFHPPHLTVVQQNRAIALSYYAAAPIVLLVIPSLLGWAFLLLERYKPGWDDHEFLLPVAMGMVMGFTLIGALFLTWFTTLRMLRHATLCSTARVAAMGVTLPIAWVLLAALILVGLPWLAGFAMIVVWSFR